jgi:hypothetical protein
MKFNRLTLTATLSSVLLLGCGGGNNETTKTASNSSESGFSTTPVTPLDKVTFSKNEGLTTITTGAGFEGDIVYFQDTDDLSSVRLKLRDGIPSLNIVDIKRTLYASYECSTPVILNGQSFSEGGWKITYDFKTGNVVRTGLGDFAKLMPSCRSTFNSPLPRTIASEMSITLLLIWGFLNPTSTNCPTASSSSSESVDELDLCASTDLINYVLTDDSGKTHKLALSTRTANN